MTPTLTWHDIMLCITHDISQTGKSWKLVDALKKVIGPFTIQLPPSEATRVPSRFHSFDRTVYTQIARSCLHVPKCINVLNGCMSWSMPHECAHSTILRCNASFMHCNSLWSCTCELLQLRSLCLGIDGLCLVSKGTSFLLCSVGPWMITTMIKLT